MGNWEGKRDGDSGANGGVVGLLVLRLYCPKPRQYDVPWRIPATAVREIKFAKRN
jgi:hypothetical protein